MVHNTVFYVYFEHTIFSYSGFLLKIYLINQKNIDNSKNYYFKDGKKYVKATFAAGCFWGVEELFRHLNGVKDTKAGYVGGSFENPTYQDVCSGKTGHAEAIQIEYDPKDISYEELLKVFWNNHNPTTLNQQGPDIGEQYRSAVFFHDSEQESTAKKLKETLQDAAIKRFGEKIVTEIIPATKFFKAEEYHQRYLEKNGLAQCSSKIN